MNLLKMLYEKDEDKFDSLTVVHVVYATGLLMQETTNMKY